MQTAKRWAGIILAAAGLCLMLYGIGRGQMMDVWQKAARVCMECIGLG